jgi:hypothetical protein
VEEEAAVERSSRARHSNVIARLNSKAIARLSTGEVHTIPKIETNDAKGSKLFSQIRALLVPQESVNIAKSVKRAKVELGTAACPKA